MYRLGGVHSNALSGQGGLYAEQVVIGTLAVHAPGQRGVAAESFLVDKVAPAAHALTNQEAYPNQIKERQDGDAADLGHQAAKHKCADDRAVNGNTALADIDHLPDAFILERRKHNIINARRRSP